MLSKYHKVSILFYQITHKPIYCFIMSEIRILIVDDHCLVAESLFSMLDKVENFLVVGLVNNGWQALDFVEKNKTDIVLADYHMPLLNGLELINRLRERSINVKTIILTMNEEVSLIKDCIQAGVSGFVMKSATKNTLIKAINTVASGERYFSEGIINKLSAIPNPNGKTQVDDIEILTKRELDVVKLIVDNHSNIQIADKLSIGITTVESHRRNLMKKIGVNTAVGLVRWGLRNGVLEIK